MTSSIDTAKNIIYIMSIVIVFLSMIAMTLPHKKDTVVISVIAIFLAIVASSLAHYFL